MVSDFETRRLAFGDKLRRLREQAGLKGSELAERLGWAGSKVSKIETGKQTATDTDLSDWCVEVGAPVSTADELRAELRNLRVQQLGWSRQLRAGHRARQELSASTWRTAIQIRGVASKLVPGVLQTADYMRAVFERQASLLRVPRDIDASIAARLERQQLLYQPGRDIEILVAETALTNPPCSPQVMAAQVDRLVSVVGLPTVRFGIVPLYRPLPVLLQDSFWIFDDAVQVEAVTTDDRITDPDQVAVFNRLADELWSAAVTGNEAQAVLLAVGRRWAEAR
ncbi:toxin-antitoxin system, antitoxin component [Kutzneria sp. 744]|nr:toxin-antitoxin system, antitoxin component [Kutzneria sp. 744]